MVLRAASWQCNSRLLRVLQVDDFVPAEFADFIAPAGSQNQQPNNIAVVLTWFRQAAPHRDQFVVGQNPVTLHLIVRIGPLYRIRLAIALTKAPSVKGMQ